MCSEDEQVIEQLLHEIEEYLMVVPSVEDSVPFGLGEVITESVQSVFYVVQELFDLCRHSKKGRPQIPISEEHLMYLI